MSILKRLAVFISGRGSNMHSIAEAINSGVLKNLCEIVLVFSDNPDAYGLKIADEMHLRIACVESAGRSRREFEEKILVILEELHLDYIILAGFKRILTLFFINHFRGRIINVHPADPAAYKGLHGYRYAFEQRLEKTQVTVHYVDEGVDTGHIIASREVDLRGTSRIEEIEQRGLSVEHVLYPEAIASLCRGEIPNPLLKNTLKK